MTMGVKEFSHIKKGNSKVGQRAHIDFERNMPARRARKLQTLAKFRMMREMA